MTLYPHACAVLLAHTHTHTHVQGSAWVPGINTHVPFRSLTHKNNCTAPPPTYFNGYPSHAPIPYSQRPLVPTVIVIIPYDGVDEAVNITNDTIYGLNNAVVGADQDAAMEVASRLRSGQVQVNSLKGSPMTPFGGYKQSGDGREWGTYGLDEFLQIKAINRPAPRAKAKL